MVDTADISKLLSNSKFGYNLEMGSARGIERLGISLKMDL